MVPAAENVITGAQETYALLEVIGRGAYGVVYKGIGRRDGRVVAVKRVGRAKLTSDEEKQVQEEVSLLRVLNDSHIVKYVEAVDDPASPYLDIVMEYVEGGSLFTMVRDIRKSLIDRHRVLGEEPAAMYIRQVVLGLRYLHRQGVVHSDIKGANILVTKNRGVKLADFGLASTKLGKDVLSNDKGPKGLLGSPYWMAPEVVAQTGKSTASDIWSVGCTVVELLTGFPPNHQHIEMAALFNIMNEECPPYPSDVSPDCEDFLRKCFVKDMRRRATADDLLMHPWLNSSDTRVDDVKTGVEHSQHEAMAREDVLVNGLAGLEMYEEQEGDDDFGDIDFDDAPNGASTADGRGADYRRSARSVDVYDDDPFRDVKDDPEAELERERKRNQKELWDRIKGHVEALGTGEHVAACGALVGIFGAHPEQRYNLIYDPGLHPILDILERGGEARDIESMLRVSLSVLGADDVRAHSPIRRRSLTRSSSAWLDTDAAGYFQTANIPHDLCLAGFLPAVMRYCSAKHSYETRQLAARFIERMLDEESTMHMFIACRGFTVFVELLDDDVMRGIVLNRVALGGIERMLSMDNQRHKRDFCRRFVSAGLLRRLARNIGCTMRLVGAKRAQRDDALLPHITLLARLLQTFAARADPAVKRHLSDSEVLVPLIALLAHEDVPREAAASVLCCLRDISRDPSTHDALQRAGAIAVLVAQLSVGAARTASRAGKPVHHVVSTLHNLCILSAPRQQEAVSAGLVPHLVRYIRSNDMNLRALCVDIYSGLACASHETRVELSKCDGVDFYVELLHRLSVPGTVRKWQARVLQAMCEWLEDATQTALVECRLVDERNSAVLCSALAGVGVEDVEGVLEPYWRLVTTSTKLNRAYGRNNELVSAMVKWLDRMHDERARSRSFGGPRGRLLLLRTILAHAKFWRNESVHIGLVQALRVVIADVIEADESIMVRKQASQLLDALDCNNK